MQPSLPQSDIALSPELDELHACTRLLQQGEYRIFQNAFRAWFGQEARDADLEPGFGAYLRGLRLPPWVRHYCREVISEAEADGRLGVDTAARRRDISCETVCLAVTAALLIVVASLS